VLSLAEKMKKLKEKIHPTSAQVYTSMFGKQRLNGGAAWD
jgi:hypothetical protein